MVLIPAFHLYPLFRLVLHRKLGNELAKTKGNYSRIVADDTGFDRLPMSETVVFPHCFLLVLYENFSASPGTPLTNIECVLLTSNAYSTQFFAFSEALIYF